MNDYTHLQNHNRRHKDLVSEAEKRHLANDVQKQKPTTRKNILVQLLTLVTRS